MLGTKGEKHWRKSNDKKGHTGLEGGTIRVHVRSSIQQPVARGKRTPGGRQLATCIGIKVWTEKISHFFHTIFVLKTFSGVNFFLAVEEVLGGSLALGRLLRLLTQLGMDLRARPGSGKKTSLEAKSRRTSSGSSSSSAASASPATSSWGSASDTLDSSGASACRVPATRDEKNEEMLIVRVACSLATPVGSLTRGPTPTAIACPVSADSAYPEYSNWFAHNWRFPST